MKMNSVPSFLVPSLYTRLPLHSAKHRTSAFPSRVTPICVAAEPNTTAAKRLPRHWRIPAIGFLLENFLIKDLSVKLARKYGDIYRSEILGNSVVMVSSPELIGVVTRNPTLFCATGAFPSTFTRLLGEDALFTLDGAQHAKLKGLLRPAFTQALHKSYFSTIQNHAKQFFDNLAGASGQGGLREHVKVGGSTSEGFAMNSVLERLYFKNITSLTAGLKEENNPEEYERTRLQFLAIVKGLVSVPVPIGPWPRALAARSSLVHAIKGLIERRLLENYDVIEAIRSYDDKRAAIERRQNLQLGAIDIFDVILANTSLTSERGGSSEGREQELAFVANQVIMLWVAGYETTGTTTSSAILEMLRNRDVLSKLVQEQDDIERESGDLCEEQVNKGMPLLDAFVTEVMRLRPSVATMYRRAKEDTTIGGYQVAAGEGIALDFLGASRNEKVYSNPDAIDLYRYIKNPEKKVTLPFLTFGMPGSAHYCLGASLARFMIKTTISTLLRDYELTLDENQSMDYRSIPTYAPKSGVIIRDFRRRSSTKRRKEVRTINC